MMGKGRGFEIRKTLCRGDEVKIYLLHSDSRKRSNVAGLAEGRREVGVRKARGGCAEMWASVEETGSEI